MLIFIQYYGNELTIEEYETEWGIRYKAYSGDRSEVQFEKKVT
jgi:hypothetical protein